jgi:hypothetical protein
VCEREREKKTVYVMRVGVQNGGRRREGEKRRENVSAIHIELLRRDYDVHCHPLILPPPNKKVLGLSPEPGGPLPQLGNGDP